MRMLFSYDYVSAPTALKTALKPNIKVVNPASTAPTTSSISIPKPPNLGANVAKPPIIQPTQGKIEFKPVIKVTNPNSNPPPVAG